VKVDGVVALELDRSAASARHAEATGYDGVWSA
jgi:alkanesulfonate monooxygenase SsuD/methylene tetrahydromethanopterin reductase-like flavin-dependent oxidoreductase (luciferase family)